MDHTGGGDDDAHDENAHDDDDVNDDDANDNDNDDEDDDTNDIDDTQLTSLSTWGAGVCHTYHPPRPTEPGVGGEFYTLLGDKVRITVQYSTVQ